MNHTISPQFAPSLSPLSPLSSSLHMPLSPFLFPLCLSSLFPSLHIPLSPVLLSPFLLPLLSPPSLPIPSPLFYYIFLRVHLPLSSYLSLSSTLLFQLPLSPVRLSPSSSPSPPPSLHIPSPLLYYIFRRILLPLSSPCPLLLLYPFLFPSLSPPPLPIPSPLFYYIFLRILLSFSSPCPSLLLYPFLLPPLSPPSLPIPSHPVLLYLSPCSSLPLLSFLPSVFFG